MVTEDGMAATHLRDVAPLRLICIVFLCILVGSSGLCRGGQASAGAPPPGLGQQLHRHHIPINGPADRGIPTGQRQQLLAVLG